MLRSLPAQGLQTIARLAGITCSKLPEPISQHGDTTAQAGLLKKNELAFYIVLLQTTKAVIYHDSLDQLALVVLLT